MVKGSFVGIQDALYDLQALLHLVPTNPSTSASDKTRISQALNALSVAAHHYGKRTSTSREGGEANRRGDWLDAEGVNLYNFARDSMRLLSAPGEQSDRLVLAHLQYAGFKLIEAASTVNSYGPYRVRLLNLAAKTTTALLDAGDTIKAGNVCIAAAELEAGLSDVSGEEGVGEAKDRLHALMAYYSSRYHVAIKENNETLAFTMLQKAAVVDQKGVLGPEPLRNIAGHFWETGNQLRQLPNQLDEACLWLQTGLDVLGKVEALGGILGVQELKIALFRAAVRAELAKPALDEAGLRRVSSSLSELSILLNTMDPQSVQEIKSLQLHVVQQQQAKEGEVRSALISLIQTMPWSDDSVSEILGEVAGVTKYKDLQTLGRQELLIRSVKETDGHQFTARITLGILLGVRKLEQDTQSALRIVTQALDKIGAASLQLTDKTAVTACQTVIWSFGEKTFQSKQHAQSAQWYSLAAHSAFKECGRDNFSKCRRKAALAFIHASDFAGAQAQLDMCPPNEASTQYLCFLVAARQGREVAATSAIEAILNCPDLDGKQLLLMAQVANENAQHGALTACLAALLTAMSRPESASSVQVHGLTLIRCLVNITLEELRKAEEKGPLGDALLHYLQAAHAMIDQLIQSGETQEHLKAIAWLYKTAYNAGVEGATSWSPGLLSNVFDTAAQMMTLYQSSGALDIDPQLPLQRATAMFACFCGKLFVHRELAVSDEKAALLVSLVSYIPEVREAISTVNKGVKADKIGSMLSTLMVLECELLCEQGDWEALEMAARASVEGSQNGYDSNHVMESIVTILSLQPSCPTSLTCRILERVLQVSTTASTIDIKHFARWNRSLVSILLHRSKPEDDDKAVHFLAKAESVLKTEAGRKGYPAEEVQWMVATAWNKGLEQFGPEKLDKAKLWCELALSLSESVPAAAGQRKMMVDYYQKLLNKVELAQDVSKGN